MSSLRKKTLKGMQWSLLGTLGSFVLQIVVMIVITRLVAPEDFGVLAMAQLFVQFASFFANFGVGTAILRKHELTEDHIAAGFWCGMVISVCIAFILFFLAPYSTHLLDSPHMVNVVRLLALNFLLSGLGIVSMSLLQRQMRFGYLAIVTLISYALGYGLIGIPLALKGYGAYAIVFCMLAQTIIRIISQYVAARHRIRPSAKIEIYKETLSFGGQHSFAGFLSFAGSSVDRLMLGRWGGAETLGIYSRGSHLINYPIQFLSGSVSRVLFPGFSSIQRNKERMRSTYRKSMEIMAFILIPIACFASITSREMILVAFGTEWVDGWPALVAYAWIAPLTVLGMMGMMVNDIIGKQRYRILIHMHALVIFVATIWFGLQYGIKGVAVAVVCGHLYRFVFTSALVGRLLQFDRVEQFKIYAWPMTAGLVTTTAPAMVSIFGGNLPAGMQLLFSAVGAAVALFVLIVCVPIPPLLYVVDMLEESHTRLKPLLKWIRRK